MYTPVEVSKKVESQVCHGIMKKYYRFRATRFYGGIATADTVGCNLRCVFCWSANSVWNAEQTGEFYTPTQVAQKLRSIAEKKHFTQLRISGGEPTIGRQHLIEVLSLLNDDYVFILETNGLLLGVDPSYSQELSGFKKLHVRVCLKGASAPEFSWLTGASEEGFMVQLKALEYLRDQHMQFNIALVTLSQDTSELFNQLHTMGLGDIMVEDEEISLYPQVRQRLQKLGLLNHFMKPSNKNRVKQ